MDELAKEKLKSKAAKGLENSVLLQLLQKPEGERPSGILETIDAYSLPFRRAIGYMQNGAMPPLAIGQAIRQMGQSTKDVPEYSDMLEKSTGPIPDSAKMAIDIGAGIAEPDPGILGKVLGLAGVIYSPKMLKLVKSKQVSALSKKMKKAEKVSELDKKIKNTKLVYHGSTGPIKGELSLDKLGSGAGNRELGSGFYVADNPDLASAYAQGEKGANVTPLRISKSGLVDMEQKAKPRHITAMYQLFYASPIYKDYSKAADLPMDRVKKVMMPYEKVAKTEGLGKALKMMEEDLYQGNGKAFAEELYRLGISGRRAEVSAKNKEYIYSITNPQEAINNIEIMSKKSTAKKELKIASKDFEKIQKQVDEFSKKAEFQDDVRRAAYDEMKALEESAKKVEQKIADMVSDKADYENIRAMKRYLNYLEENYQKAVKKYTEGK